MRLLYFIKLMIFSQIVTYGLTDLAKSRDAIASKKKMFEQEEVSERD